MVQTIVKLGEHEDRLLTIIKGKYGLKNKSDAVNFLIGRFEESLEPELRPEYIQKALAIHSQPSIKIGSVENLRKRYGK